MRMLAACTLLAAGTNAVPMSVQDERRTVVPSSNNDLDDGAARPQAPTRCFIEPAWTRDQIVQQKAVPFGQSFNNQTGKMQTLLLDTYEPPTSDTRTR